MIKEAHRFHYTVHILEAGDSGAGGIYDKTVHYSSGHFPSMKEAAENIISSMHHELNLQAKLDKHNSLEI